MSFPTRLHGFLPCALALLATPAPQESRPRPEWPALTQSQRITVNRALQGLRKSPAGIERTRWSEELVKVGTAAAPLVLKAFSRTQDPGLARSYRGILDRITGARQALLIARELSDRSLLVRSWAVERLMRLDAVVALAAVQALQEKEKDPDLRSLCSITRLRFGDRSALPEVEGLARGAWVRWRDDAHMALTKVRGGEVSRRAAKLLLDEKRSVRLAGLRLLAGGGDPSAVPSIRPFLDSTDRELQEAAVNALRGILENKSPRYELPVFRLIEEAEKWKRKIAR